MILVDVGETGVGAETVSASSSRNRGDERGDDGKWTKPEEAGEQDIPPAGVAVVKTTNENADNRKV